MDRTTLTYLNDLVEEVLLTSKHDAEGVEVYDDAYLDHDGIVKASIAQWGNNRRKKSWLVEVGVLVDRAPFEVTDVVFKTSLDSGETWSEPRDSAPDSLRERGARIRQHVIGLRDAGRFATREQGSAAIASLMDLFAAVRSGDENGLAESMKQAQALLCQITAEVPPPARAAAEGRKRGPKPRIEGEIRFNIAGLMAKVNESRAGRGEDTVARKDWPEDRRAAQPYIDELRSVGAAPGPR